MRIIFAALFVFIGITVIAATITDENRLSSPLVANIALAAGFAALLALATMIFNSRGRRPVTDPAKLQELGLLTATTSDAIRAFLVESYEDEGAHYFIELIDKTVLYLNGFYLIDFEPDYDDADSPLPTLFPCTKFTIRRHRVEEYAIDIVCEGAPRPLEAAIDIETVTPPSPNNDCLHGVTLRDGLILPGLSYEKIKERFTITT